MAVLAEHGIRSLEDLQRFENEMPLEQRLPGSVVHGQLALPQARVQVTEGGRRGMRVNVALPEAARLSVPAVERALAAYLFEARVAVE